MITVRIDTIQCPNCDHVQDAKVERYADNIIDGVVYSYPWLIYVHSCVKCAHIITEGDWQAPEPEVSE